MNRCRRTSWQTGALVAAAFTVWVVGSGYSSAALFETPASQGGGEGLLYTGSATSHGMHCGSCHQGDVRHSGAKVTADPASLFATGYEPAKRYTITVAIDAESRGLDRQGACEEGQGGCNRNGFMAELVGDHGAAIGTLCADGGTIGDNGCDQSSGKESSIVGGGKAVGGHSLKLPELCLEPGDTNCFDMAAQKAAGKTPAEINAALKAAIKGRTSWRFVWRAPDSSQPVNLFIGVVDGDGGNTVDPHHNDYVGDTVLLVNRRILREGQSDHAWPTDGRPHPDDPASCSAQNPHRGKFPAAAVFIMLTCIIMMLMSRSRSRA